MNQKNEETREMIKLFEDQGLSLTEIARRYGISVTAVRGRFDRRKIVYGRRKFNFSVIDQARLANSYEIQRLPLSQIAVSFGVTVETIKKALSHYGIPRRRPLKSDGKNVDILRKLNFGESVETKLHGKAPHAAMSNAARRCGVRVSVQFLGDDCYRITKVRNRNEPPPVLIDKCRLEMLYTEKRLPLARIRKAFRCGQEAVDQALKFYGIAKRPSLKKGGKFIGKFRQLKISEKIRVECAVKYPVSNLHSIAARVNIRISLRALGGGFYEVTRVG